MISSIWSLGSKRKEEALFRSMNPIPPKLVSLSADKIAKKIYDCMIDIECEDAVTNLVKGFIVQENPIPRLLLLQVVRFLLIYLDRGYNRFLDIKPPTDLSHHQYKCTVHGSFLRERVTTIGRRARHIMKAVVHCLIAVWGEKPIMPYHFLRGDNTAPSVMITGGMDVVMTSMIESFMFWANSELSGNSRNWKSSKEPCPPNELNLEGNQEYLRFTEIAISTIMSFLKRKSPFTRRAASTVNSFLKAFSCACVSAAYAENLKTNHPPRRRFVIKLDLTLWGTFQDWLLDDLLFILRHAATKGVEIEICSLRTVYIELKRLQEVIESLPFPERLRYLHFKSDKPASLFALSGSLEKLTGIERFICS